MCCTKSQEQTENIEELNVIGEDPRENMNALFLNIASQGMQ